MQDNYPRDVSNAGCAVLIVALACLAFLVYLWQ